MGQTEDKARYVHFSHFISSCRAFVSRREFTASRHLRKEAGCDDQSCPEVHVYPGSQESRGPMDRSLEVHPKMESGDKPRQSYFFVISLSKIELLRIQHEPSDLQRHFDQFETCFDSCTLLRTGYRARLVLVPLYSSFFYFSQINSTLEVVHYSMNRRNLDRFLVVAPDVCLQDNCSSQFDPKGIKINKVACSYFSLTGYLGLLLQSIRPRSMF